MKVQSRMRLEVNEAVVEASRYLNALYPLTNFIACNALKGLEDIPFTDAMKSAKELFGAEGFLPLKEYRAMYETGRIAPADLDEAFERNKSHSSTESTVPQVSTLAELFDEAHGTQIVETLNQQMVKWLGAWLDKTQAQSKPRNTGSLYAFWKDIARYDLSLKFRGVSAWDRIVTDLPGNSKKVLEDCLAEIYGDTDDVVSILRRHLLQLPGYASHLKWRQFENGEDDVLRDYLAIRSLYEKVLCQLASQRIFGTDELESARTRLASLHKGMVRAQQQDYGPVWQDAYELNYMKRLLSSLKPDRVEDNSCCQLVFCIDVRSEPIRRHLERLGPYSTFGFAGFFGMPMRLKPLGSAMSLDLCPVLLKPDKDVHETGSRNFVARMKHWQALKVSVLQLKKKLKCSLAGAFGLVELLGIFSAVPLLTKTFSPLWHRRWLQAIDEAAGGKNHSHLDLSGLPLPDKVSFAKGAIKGIGFTRFSKLVVLCGHRSISANNPFASALDCGACGANGGGSSARLAALVLNDKDVRAHLAQDGIEIPDSTVFVAAEHETTSDQFNFFDTCNVSGEHASILTQLKTDLAKAGESVRAQRLKTLPQNCLPMSSSGLERGHDWAQIAPEWGLAGNAAFVAAPRAISKDADLEGRVFLHSYDHALDSDGKVLELILTAPLVVAQWINMQYYLSSVDNRKFGSGSKVVHNVVGDFGVMTGAASDLRLGLPLQSIATADGRQHEPMRLLAVVRAPMSSIDRVLAAHPEVGQLVANRWVRLVALDPMTNGFYEAEDCGKWKHFVPSTAPTSTTGPKSQARHSARSITSIR